MSLSLSLTEYIHQHVYVYIYMHIYTYTHTCIETTSGAPAASPPGCATPPAAMLAVAA